LSSDDATTGESTHDVVLKKAWSFAIIAICSRSILQLGVHPSEIAACLKHARKIDLKEW
jgi:hypothetical protein